MNTIWKFELRLADMQEILVPYSARFIHVAMQGEKMFIWALVDTGNQPVKHLIEICGTGNPTASNPEQMYREYVGTVHERQFVWHVFATREPQ